MSNRKIFRELAGLKTSGLIIAKMGCTQRIATFGSLTRAAVALLGIVIGQLGKTLYTEAVLAWIDWISIAVAVYCGVAYWFFNRRVAQATAVKEAIDHLISVRQNL